MTALIMRRQTWGVVGGAMMAVTLLLSFFGATTLQTTPLLNVSLCVTVALMCMALLNFVLIVFKIPFAYSRMVSKVFSRMDASSSRWSQLRDAFILFLARPSNFEGVLGILFGIFGYAIGHELVWGDL